jgi:hypothetical protein
MSSHGPGCEDQGAIRAVVHVRVERILVAVVTRVDVGVTIAVQVAEGSAVAFAAEFDLGGWERSQNEISAEAIGIEDAAVNSNKQRVQIEASNWRVCKAGHGDTPRSVRRPISRRVRPRRTVDTQQAHRTAIRQLRERGDRRC